MLKSFEHVGMTAGNMERTIDFRCGHLGLELRLRKTNADGITVELAERNG